MSYQRILITAAALLVAAPWGAGAQAPARGEPTAGDALKNVQVLKHVPMSDWVATMQFISGSLGVSCDFCHTYGNFESDSKQAKRTARDMIRMVMAIDKEHFGGGVVVTCNTCHRGAIHPNAVPEVWAKTAEQFAAYRAEVQAAADSTRPSSTPTPGQPAAAPPLPSAQRIIAAYRAAVGAEHLKTLHVAGPVNNVNAPVPNADITFRFPDEMLIRIMGPGGPIQEVVNGDHGWLVSPQRRIPLTAAQVRSARATAHLYAPIKLDVDLAAARVTGIDTADGRRCYVLASETPKVIRHLYFGIASGLLYKVREETRTVLGTATEEHRFRDYRDVGGTKLPFSIVSRYLENRIDRTIVEATPNVAIDPHVFEVADGRGGIQ